MYGPPSDCKGKVEVCVNVSGLLLKRSPGHDEIRRVPVLINLSALEGHLQHQVSGPPF